MRAFALMALALAAPLAAETDPLRAIDYAAELAAIGRYQDVDQRLQDIGWRLAAANAPYCSKVVQSIGLRLQDMASYGAPDIARQTLGLKGDFAVQNAARGSPAALSGAFTRNREIAGVDGVDPNSWPARPPMDWARPARLQDYIDGVLAERGTIAITFAGGETVTIQPVPVCASRFELMGDSGTAAADGSRVVIGIRSHNLGYEDELFAGTVGHELSHNVLGHDAWLDRNGRSNGNVRRIEREADRLIPWLFANAGYDPAKAVEYMQRWGSEHDSGFLRPRITHDGWDERAEAIAAEVPLVRALMASEGKADWAKHFRRAIDPNGGRLPKANR